GLVEAGRSVTVPTGDLRGERQGVMRTAAGVAPVNVTLIVYGNPGDPQVETAKRALYDAHKCNKAEGKLALVLANPEQGSGYEMFVGGGFIDNFDADPSGSERSYEDLMVYLDFADYLLTEERNVAALEPR